MRLSSPRRLQQQRPPVLSPCTPTTAQLQGAASRLFVTMPPAPRFVGLGHIRLLCDQEQHHRCPLVRRRRVDCGVPANVSHTGPHSLMHHKLPEGASMSCQHIMGAATAHPSPSNVSLITAAFPRASCTTAPFPLQLWPASKSLLETCRGGSDIAIRGSVMKRLSRFLQIINATVHRRGCVRMWGRVHTIGACRLETSVPQKLV